MAVKSGNGLGKDFTAAVAVLWYVHAHDPAIVLSTAPTFRQVRHVLWRQIHRLYRNAADTLGGRMLDTRWEVAEDRYAMGLSASDADQFQGFHCENMFVVVDEAEGVAEPIYEAVEAVMTSAHPTLLLIGNPTTTSGGFHRAFHRERGIYETITMSALESPNVVANRIEIPGLTTPAWVEERRAMWGENSEMFRARVMGEFPDRGEDNLIAISDIDDATYPLGEVPAATGGYEPVVLGVDVARFGVDRTVIMVRRGRRGGGRAGAPRVPHRCDHRASGGNDAGPSSAAGERGRDGDGRRRGGPPAGAGVHRVRVQRVRRALGGGERLRQPAGGGLLDAGAAVPRPPDPHPPGRGADRRAGVAALPLQQPGQGADGEQGQHEEPRPALAGQGRRPDAGLPGHRPHDRTPALDAGPVPLIRIVRSRIHWICGFSGLGSPVAESLQSCKSGQNPGNPASDNIRREQTW